jgi:uncharacterized membrane protein (UPF0127 family)
VTSLLTIATAALLGLSACDSADAPAAETVTILGDSPAILETLTITTVAGTSVGAYVEIAETPEQRSRGLMGRDALEPDSGMLFVIDPPGRGFWMRGTTVALTVAFIGACGEIVDLADLEPFSEEIKNTRRPYAFALEMQQGWFAANGVEVGDAVEIPERFRQDGC